MLVWPSCDLPLNDLRTIIFFLLSNIYNLSIEETLYHYSIWLFNKSPSLVPSPVFLPYHQSLAFVPCSSRSIKDLFWVIINENYTILNSRIVISLLKSKNLSITVWIKFSILQYSLKRKSLIALEISFNPVVLMKSLNWSLNKSKQLIFVLLTIFYSYLFALLVKD